MVVCGFPEKANFTPGISSIFEQLFMVFMVVFSHFHGFHGYFSLKFMVFMVFWTQFKEILVQIELWRRDALPNLITNLMREKLPAAGENFDHKSLFSWFFGTNSDFHGFFMVFMVELHFHGFHGFHG